SATDHATWTIQIASALTEQVRLVAYDRRGIGRSPAEEGAAPTIERHADDLAALIDDEGDDGAATVVGSSFGAAVVLDACRRWPARVRSAVLIEPPLGASDEVPAVPVGFLPALDALAAEQGPEAAAERFLRTVLGHGALGRPHAARRGSPRLPPAGAGRGGGGPRRGLRRAGLRREASSGRVPRDGRARREGCETARGDRGGSVAGRR